jgi:hypothetical protein
MADDQIEIKISADIAELQAGLQQAQEDVEASLEAMRHGIESPDAAFAQLGSSMTQLPGFANQAAAGFGRPASEQGGLLDRGRSSDGSTNRQQEGTNGGGLARSGSSASHRFPAGARPRAKIGRGGADRPRQGS